MTLLGNPKSQIQPQIHTEDRLETQSSCTIHHGVFGLTLIPSRGCARVYSMGIALEPSDDLGIGQEGSIDRPLFPQGLDIPLC
jgi:hypothetical protein